METWTQSADATAAIVTGRALKPWSDKINPVWWLLNDDDPVAPTTLNGVPYLPGYAPWLRDVCWWVRNPAANFVQYVIGVQDRNFTVIGTAPVRDGTLADSGRTGWKHSVILIGPLRLPFVSYAGTKWLWYVGWRAAGGFGMKINRHG